MIGNRDNGASIERARLALEGLSLGDAFGQQFFHADPAWIVKRTLPPRPWRWTDDTAMALSIVDVLREFGRIEQNELAERFASRFVADPNRGYGAGAQRILLQIDEGADWRDATRTAFAGQGSMGNGAAMRVAPLGAYFADNLSAVAEQARRSAEVTHAHPEGIAGAIAVAIAAAVATINQGTFTPRVRGELLDAAIEHTPEGVTRAGLLKARELGRGCDLLAAAAELGNGSRVIAPDTVPFVLWCASCHLSSFEDAMWATVAVGGDIDTNAAIVGGIVACAVGRANLPAAWLKLRETLPQM